MLAHFHQNVQVASNQIRAALRDGRHELIERAAHKLVGTSELLGFKTFAKQSRILVELLRYETENQNILEASYNYLEKCDTLSKTLETSCPSLKIHL
jgi:HPt (histidine-containing phosphotransfer) domain-containing protein